MGRSGYILQERVDFRPVIETPFGANKIEGRGAQMGVDYNKGMEWVGGSAAFYQRG
jgi:hypothetical protein